MVSRAIFTNIGAKMLLPLVVGVLASVMFFTQSAFAAAPTASSAVINNSSASGFDIVVTGTNFDAFVSSNTTTANGTDLAKISYHGASPTAATINNATTMTLTFALSVGTGKSGGSLTMAVNTVQDSGDVNNALITIVDGSITDSASPVVTAVDFSRAVLSPIFANTIVITYSEPILISTDAGGDTDISVGNIGASSTTLGAMTTARTLTGIGTWNGTSDMTTNSVGGNSVALDATGTILTVYINGNTVASYYNAGSIAPTTPTFTPTADATDITDVSDNAVNTATRTATNNTAWDVTVPTISTTYSCDIDGDGDIDRMEVTASEAIIDDNIAGSNPELDNDTTNNGVGEESATFNTETTGCSGLSADVDLYDEKFRLDVATGINGTDIAYLNLPTAFATDRAGNRFATGANLGTETDRAAPRLMSSSPVASARDVDVEADIVLTFSEQITAITAALSPSVTLTNGTSLPASAVTLTSTKNAGKTYTLTISSAPDATGNAFGGGGAATHPFAFRTAGGSSGTVVVTVVHPIVSLTTLNNGGTYHAGDSVNIGWTSSGGVGSVDLQYSVDGGSSYVTFASGLSANGSYPWTIPSVSSADALVRVVGYDVTTIVATDVSDAALTFIATTSSGDDDEEEPIIEDGGEGYQAGAGEEGISPFTGKVETIDAVRVGEFIKAPSSSTVYYVDTGFVRRPFFDYQTYKSYGASIRTVTDATLPSLTLGAPMLPKAGVVLVKIQSDARVFALTINEDGKTELHWVPTEVIAKMLYGSAWADYVIDVPVTLFTRFAMGEDYTGSEVIDRLIMMTRITLNK